MYYSEKCLSIPTNMSTDRIEHDKALRWRLTDCDFSTRETFIDGIIGDCYRSGNPLPLSTPISLCGIESMLRAALIGMSDILSINNFLVNLNFTDDKSPPGWMMIDIETANFFLVSSERNVNQPSSINRLMNQLLAIILKFRSGVIRTEDCWPSCEMKKLQHCLFFSSDRKNSH